MSMSLNKVQLIGNLTRDPEVKQIPGGQVVAAFGLATNLVWTDSSGQRQNRPEFHNIVAWRKLAEICGQYLRKGSKIYIEGRLQTRDWEGEDGIKRYRTEIVADNMIMLDRKGEGPAGVDGETAGIAGGAKDTDREAKGISEGASVAEGERIKGKEQVPVIEEGVDIDDLPF